ncbi:MAG: hypothetical protein ACI9ON_000690 [Limisphaerales bacterium]|jgi:uncharacterized protein (TIGR03084 family)
MIIHNANAELGQVVADLAAEGASLHELLSDMDTGIWTQSTTFKQWSVWDVVAHLHFADHMALTSITSSDDFANLMKRLRDKSIPNYAGQWLSDEQGNAINGPELLERWYSLFNELCENLARADPTKRFDWVGPGMKAKMFATARLMETWAHGWEIYDLTNIPRDHTDRLSHIATIGVRTFGWTFNNRGLPVPDQPPFVCLSAPSGDEWTWNEANVDDCIRGSAVDFCQVVTQVRNVADTNLEVVGDAALAWMNIAQCFAGPPEDPPAPGSRTPK